MPIEGVNCQVDVCGKMATLHKVAAVTSDKLYRKETFNYYRTACAIQASSRACLDQLLIAIRSFTLLWDHSRSKTRLITDVNLIAKLGIIYATACHTSLYTTVFD